MGAPISDFEQQLAVVIGIGNYAVGRFRLDNSVADARDVVTALQAHHYQVAYFEDQEATARSLARYFAFELPALVKSNAQLLVYFAGHGLAHTDDTYRFDGSLLPYDAGEDGQRFLRMRFLRTMIARLPCRHVLLVLDCCFAGLFASRVYRDINKPAPPLYMEQYREYLRRNARQLIASSSHDELAIDRIGTQRGFFTSSFVAALSDAAIARDGVLTATELYSHLRHAAKGQLQTPNLWPLEGHDDGEYVFTVSAPALKSATELHLLPNPYRGLRYYETGNADEFGGRDAVIEQLVLRVASHALTVLVGPSGSGKSSVLHAGVHGKVSSEMHAPPPVRLGPGPLTALEALLRAVPADGRRTCLIIDQLDDLTNASANDRRAAQLVIARLIAVDGVPQDVPPELASLVKLADGLRGRVAVVLGLRTDAEPHFIDALGAWLGTEWTRAIVQLPRMNRDELREAILKPVARDVVFFTTQLRDGEGKPLVDTILDELEQMPDALPLLSVALERMFSSFMRRLPLNRTIDWRDYPSAGGIAGALQEQAASLYENGPRALALTGAKLDAFRAMLPRVLRRMVAWRNGLTRRPVRLSTLAWKDQVDTDLANTVVDALIAERLVVPIEDGVQPVHDVLLTGWPWLFRLLQDDLKLTELHADLQDATARWLRSSKARDDLWRRRDLPRLDVLPVTPAATRSKRLVRWLWRHGAITFPLTLAEPLVLTAPEHDFVAASLRARRRTRAIAAGVLASVFALLTVVSLVVRAQRDTAREATRNEAIARTNLEAQNRVVSARALGLTAAALVPRDDGPAIEQAALLAVESMKLYPTAQADAVLRACLSLLPLREDALLSSSSAPAPRRYSIDRSGSEPALRVAATGEVLTFFRTAPVSDLVVSPDERWLAVIDRTNAPVDPELRRLLPILGGDHASLWDLRSRKRVRLPTRHGGEDHDVELVPPVAFAPDTRFVAFATVQRPLVVWQLGADARWKRYIEYSSPDLFNRITRTTFVDAGSPRLIIGSGYGALDVIDLLDENEYRRVFQRKASTFASFWRPVEAVAASADGRTVAVSIQKNSTHVWDIVDELELARVDTHGTSVEGLALPSSDILVIYEGGSGHRWTLSRHEARAQFPTDALNGDLVVNADGTRFAFADHDRISVAEIESATVTLRVPVPGTPVALLADRLIVAHDGRLEEWSLDSVPVLRGTLSGMLSPSAHVAISVDARTQLAAILSAEEVSVVDLQTGKAHTPFSVAIDASQLGMPRRHEAGPIDIAPQGVAYAGAHIAVWYPDGRIAVFSQEGQHLYDVPRATSVTGLDDIEVKRVVLDPAGELLLGLRRDGIVGLWQLSETDATLIHTVPVLGEAVAAAFSTDGSRFALVDLAAKTDHGERFRTRIFSTHPSDPSPFELGPDEVLATLPERVEDTNGLLFTPGDQDLLLAGDRIVLVEPLTATALIHEACARIGRSLEETEWTTLTKLPASERRTCEERPPP